MLTRRTLAGSVASPDQHLTPQPGLEVPMPNSPLSMNTVEIADKLDVLADRARLLAHALAGIDGDMTGAEERLAYEIEEGLRAISEEIHPSRPPEEIEAIRRKVEAEMAGGLKVVDNL
jgi:hypothetical protein